MKGFAYLGSHKYLHIVSSAKTAREYSINGKIEETNGIQHEAGWPKYEDGTKRYSIIVHVQGGEVTEKNKAPIPKELAELAKRLEK